MDTTGNANNTPAIAARVFLAGLPIALVLVAFPDVALWLLLLGVGVVWPVLALYRLLHG